MKLFLFHCWGGDGRSCWNGWLAERMRGKGVEVVAPDFPNPSTPRLEDWLAEVRSHVGKFDGEWVLAGHSLGCPAILRLLEAFGPDERVGCAILVSGFARDIGIPELRNFVDGGFDWQKIRSKAGRFIVIHSDDDPFIELSEAERVSSLLGAELVVERGAGHINAGSGFGPYPRLAGILDSLGSD
jgi:predicted alpha/beta hydrolase family esterase